jgi:chemotaxis protein histidine kinase CheA/ActR/RegA family two-component response regulator
VSDDGIMSDLIEAFRSEVGELFDELASLVAELPDCRGSALQSASRSAMRLAHNLKGASGSVGLKTLSRVAHQFEGALSPLARAELAPSVEHMSALRSAVIAMQALAERTDGDSEQPGLAALVEQLQSFSRVSAAPQAISEPRPTIREPKLSPDLEIREITQGSNESASAYLRVSSDRLDALAGHLDELLKLRGHWAQHLDQLSEEARQQEERKELKIARSLRELLGRARGTHSALSRLVADLTIDVQRIRTVTLSTVAPQWRRVVRESAEALGKKVELTVDVGDTAVDKQVLEHLRDPIVHLLRNAVDHGIEHWQERHLLGKPNAGSLTIAARMAGTGVSIEVRDDGRGVVPDEIAKAAVARGVISAEAVERLSSEDKLELLFHDGFSTAKELSTISGRGVGLAAVRRGAAQVGGRCSIFSHGEGMGTRFCLEVPISVLATTGLLVGIAEAVYMLPIANVQRALRIKGSDVRLLNGLPVLQGSHVDPIPLMTLATEDSIRVDAGSQLNVVVLAGGSEQGGLIVDEVLEQQECVTRRFPWNIKRVDGVHGVVVLDDGSMAIALDVDQLLRRRFHSVRGRGRQDRGQVTPPADSVILVVDDSLTHRTLQRNILVSSGYSVEVAVDGVEAWEKLQHKQYDLLVTDIEMPRMDGLELTRRVRLDPARKDLPIVLVTSRGKDSDIQAGAAAGADEYLVKGQFDHDKLLQAVERHLFGGER